MLPPSVTSSGVLTCRLLCHAENFGWIYPHSGCCPPLFNELNTPSVLVSAPAYYFEEYKVAR